MLVMHMKSFLCMSIFGFIFLLHAGNIYGFIVAEVVVLRFLGYIYD